jgi:hypothetical protein
MPISVHATRPSTCQQRRPLCVAFGRTRLRGEGKFTAFVGFYPTNAQPTMENVLDFFFGANRDYWDDSVVKQAQKVGTTEFDLAKRTAIYEKAVDEVNMKNDILPVSDLPIVFAHSSEVNIREDSLSPINTQACDYEWAK